MQTLSDARPVLGIDPGVTGGIALLWPNGQVVAIDIPVVGGEVDVDHLAGIIESYDPRLAIIERANAMPGQGVSSTFKYGVAYGSLRTICALGRIPYHLVTPGKWKNYFKLDRDKEKSRALAIQFWPGAGCFSRKKDHGRAEAALIARYGVEVIERPILPGQKTVPGPYWRGCNARDIPGASCQFPECPCGEVAA